MTEAAVSALEARFLRLAGAGVIAGTCDSWLTEDPGRRFHVRVEVEPRAGLCFTLECYEPCPGEDMFVRRGRFAIRYRDLQLSEDLHRGDFERWLEGLRARTQALDPAQLDDLLARARPSLERSSPRAPDPTMFTPTGPLTAREQLGAEAEFLGPLLDLYQSQFGEAPDIHETPVRGACSIHYPALSRNRVFLDAPTRFRSDARFVEYLRGLGFITDEDHQVRTVPTPAGYVALMRAGGNHSLGFVPRLIRHHRMVLPTPQWLQWVTAGIFPLNVGGVAMYRLLRPAAPAVQHVEPLRALLDTHLHALGHDMGMHVLLTHRVPTDAILRLGTRVRAEMGSLWLHFGPVAPVPLAAFYEEDLTAHCLALWEEVEHPREYEAAYRRSEARLWRTLESRIAELHRGTRGGLFLGRVMPGGVNSR